MTKTKRALPSGGMTAYEVADVLRARLTPILSGYVWHVSGPGNLGLVRAKMAAEQAYEPYRSDS